MEHLREFKEEVEIVEEESLEVHTKVVLSDPTPPTSDVLIRSRSRSKVRETGATINASLGAMRPLVGKLDMLLLRDAPLKCCSKRIKDRMHLLKEDVEKISSYLDELSKVEDPPPMAMCWMNEARDLSYDMEDYFDSLLFVPPEDPSLVAKATRSLCKLFSHVKTSQTQVISAETLSEFRMYVQEAIQRYQRYNLHSCRTLRRRFVSLGPMVLPRPYEETADIVIDGKMNEFIKSLANDGGQQLKVLSVLGSACLGKTTLARVLYRRFKNQYSCRAFIRVSKKPDMKRIFCDMLSQLQRQHPPQHCREIDLIHDIKQYLQDKRYLIIIDDVWAASVWDSINHVFPKGIHGSRIVTTTQIEDVALTCCCYQSEYVFEMKQLDDYHSRKLFFNRLFGSERDCPEQFKDVLNEIVETCDGLPLATVSIASLIASQPVMSIDLFTYIHRSLSSCFSASEKTRQALNLSFNNLPHYLKTCLMYLIIYPEGYIFCKDDLMKQLVAEGFIDTAEGQDILKVAESYLDQLIGRRFIQPICINYNNEVLSCAVHDVVHDLITLKSAEENFVVAIDYSQKNIALCHKARRLSLLFGDARYAKIPSNIRKSQVRSLRYFGLLDSMPCIREFKLLRVLDLHLSGHGGNDNPVDLTGISELFQLRYLKIACYRSIIPPKHGLQCLETLDITESRFSFVPWDIYFPHLRNLHLSFPGDRNLLCWFGQTRSVSLASLGKPNCLQNLHLTISSTPTDYDLESSMETLGSLIGGGGHGDLKSVVVAHGSWSKSFVVHGASNATISWDDEVPPPLLQRFEFSQHSCIIFDKIPSWVRTLGNLCMLKIAVKKLGMNCIDILRGLPSITALSLYVETAPIDKIVFDKAGFSVLKYFKLRFMSGIAWLNFEADAMPNLLKLKLVFSGIHQMDQYKYGIINIEHMQSLREISVKLGDVIVGPDYDLVSNHQSNPIINEQSVVCSSNGDKSRKQKQPPYEILEEERDEKLKGPADQRISRSPESSSRPHVADVLIQGRGRGRDNEALIRETWGANSASLGAMRPLVAKLDKLLLDPSHGCSFKSVKVGMHLLKEDVEELSSCLDELSEVEDPPPTAKCWMNDARSLSYKIEDYVDSLLFVQPADLSLGAKSITHANTSPKRLKWHEQIVATVSEFRKYVQEVIQQREVYVSQDSSPSSTLRCRFVSLGPMLPTPYEEIVIDGQINQFINSLANDEDQQLKVVSVLGPSCVGKTTLARVLYSKLGKRYHCRAFIWVSKKPDMKRIFREMLLQLQRQDPPEYCNEFDLIDNIKKYLQNKRYLIIIDDVWAASAWDIISHALPMGNLGSRIIATTQVESVALACCHYQSEHVFEMKPLDAHHSRKLFFNRLFGSESDCPEQFKDVLNEIVKICHGLPLATVSIASLIASQPAMTIDLLAYIRQSLSSLFSENPNPERTRQALNLSFNNLPPYLKTCLLYLSMYQEGYPFFKHDLVKQWMAEGFIDTAEGQDMEKIAESYLHQLISRRFIQPIHINYHNEVLSCAVHDVVHDLITRKSAEEDFIVAIDNSEKNVAYSHTARRLSLLFGDARYAKIPANIIKSQVRSLTYSGLFDCMPCIREFNILRVLNLQLSFHGDYDGPTPIELTGISELFQLRYLKIACNLCIKFPDHMEGLQCLETLDIMDAVMLNFPWDLPHLLHLSLPFERSLLHGIRFVKGTSRLDYLEDLHLTSSFTAAYDLERNMEALAYLIVGHRNLRSVVVAHGSTAKNTVVCGASVVITSLDRLAPPSLLQRFECSPASGITFSQIPKWFGKLGNLCILRITVRKLEINSVDILKGLPALTSLALYIWWESSDRIIFDKAGFSALKYFKLRFMRGIAWVIFEEDAMPNLWELKLVFNAIPRMDLQPHFVWAHDGRYEQYKRGNALISIERMPCLREVFAKFEGAAADLEYVKTLVRIHESNPRLKITAVQLDGQQSTKQKQQSDEILEEDPAAKRSPESSSRLHVFTLEELMYATSNFSKEMSLNGNFCLPGFYEGSFKGNLRPGLDPQQVTVKCVNMFSDDREWLLIDQMELEYLGAVCHPHLVKLLGFCDCYKHRMLIYEYTTGKNLEKHLIDDFADLRKSTDGKDPFGLLNVIDKFLAQPKTSMDEEELDGWLTRLKIAVGAAKGLAFLHKSDKLVVRGDFKASNILLDSDGSPKLFGFGLAKQNDAMVSDSDRMKRDVYNFGVVLLQLLSGRLSVDDKGLGPERNLVEWSYPFLLSEDKLHHLMDPRLQGKYSMLAVWSIVATARRCVKSVPEERPCMCDVVKALEPLLSGLADEEVLEGGGKAKQADEVEGPTMDVSFPL